MSIAQRTSRPVRRGRSAPPARVAMLLALAAVTFAGAVAAEPFCALGDDVGASLDGEEVVVELRDVPGSAAKEGCAMARVDWPPTRIFDLLLDADQYADYMPHVELSEMRPGEDGTYFNYQRLSLPFPIKDRHYTIHVVPSKPRRGEGQEEREDWILSWTYVDGSGNVKENRGSWRLRRLADRQTLVVYRVFTDPGGLVPKWAVNRATRRSLPDLMRSLRSRLEELAALEEGG